MLSSGIPARPIRTVATLAVALLAAVAFTPTFAAPEKPDQPAPEQPGKITEGRLDAIGPEGKPLGPCPLKHTDVKATISGFTAYVDVTQQFHNPYDHKIEAIYVFPLHTDAAVDAMTMTVGNRLIRGVVKERGEARQIYEQAKEAGNVASLLVQERPNIFTQSVANIEPGEKVTIQIRYSHTLKYEDGRFEFDFPMVVGPRYIPGGSQGDIVPHPQPLPVDADAKRKAGAELATPVNGAKPQAADGPDVHNPDPARPTDQVPDADRISPPVVKEGERAGHDISVTVFINAGCPIADVKSHQHEVDTRPGAAPGSVAVTLADNAVIPNKDFVLSYRPANADQIGDAVLTHTDERGKFLTLILQPPARVEPAEIVPREIVFVLDTSGSMNGFPMETSKAAMRRVLNNLRPKDKFNIITFAGSTQILFPQVAENNAANRAKALSFVDSLQGAGGTEMMKAIHEALGGEHDPATVRIVCFFTDAYVGNDMGILGAIKENAGTTRVFSFGIGRSVNRYLIDGMATLGRGEATYVLDDQQAKGAADRFYERIDAPVLTDISIDYNGLPVEAAYPVGIPDLFAAKPVVIKARYTQAAEGEIVLRGKTVAGAYERRIKVSLPANDPSDPVLAPQWARARVDYLMNQDLGGAQRQQIDDAVRNQIIALGVEYSILTQYTSFVAVEELRITEGGKARTIRVPVEMPEGVSHDGVFGDRGRMGNNRMLARKQMALSAAPVGDLAQQAPQAPAPSRPGRLEEKAKSVEEFADRDAAPDEPREPETAEQRADRLIRSKLDADLRKLVDAKSTDKVEVRVLLSDLSDDVVAKLKELGFTEIARTKSVKMVIGTIGADKLAELAQLETVVRIQKSE